MAEVVEAAAETDDERLPGSVADKPQPVQRLERQSLLLRHAVAQPWIQSAS